MDNTHPTTDAPGLGWSRRAPRTRLRVVPWQGDGSVALVGPRRDGRAVALADVTQCLETLRRRGVGHAFTAAMNPRDGRPFLEAGFELQERLHLLSLRLPSPPRSDPRAAGRTTPGRAWHLRRVLEIDQQAFDAFWRFDRRTLTEARRATPVSRYRVAASSERQGFERQGFERLGGAIVGYAVTGRAGPRGYLQRLAVAPEAAGQGYGTMLINDALDWLAERGANTVMVNTQESNGRALELYRRIGFLSEPEGLVVLSWKLAA